MDEQREMFEAWYSKHCEPGVGPWFARDKDNSDEYYMSHTQTAWDAWQAAIATVKESLTVQYEPVAWAVFADNGNSRVWFREKKYADQWVANHGGASDVLTPLYVRTEPTK